MGRTHRTPEGDVKGHAERGGSGSATLVIPMTSRTTSSWSPSSKIPPMPERVGRAGGDSGSEPGPGAKIGWPRAGPFTMAAGYRRRFIPYRDKRGARRVGTGLPTFCTGLPTFDGDQLPNDKTEAGATGVRCSENPWGSNRPGSLVRILLRNPWPWRGAGPDVRRGTRMTVGSPRPSAGTP